MTRTVEIPISDIVIDSSILLRHLNEKQAKLYGEAMRRREPFPPVDVFFDGKVYRLADGQHRIRGAGLAGRTTIDADLKDGGEREARLFACGANATNGLPRSNAERTEAVRRLLLDDEWREWSNRELARSAHVSHTTVVKIYGRMVKAGEIPERGEKTKVRRGVQTYLAKFPDAPPEKAQPAKPKKQKVGNKLTPEQNRIAKEVREAEKRERKARTQDQQHEVEAQSAIDATRAFPHDGREGAKRWNTIATEHARYMRDFWAEFVAEREGQADEKAA